MNKDGVGSMGPRSRLDELVTGEEGGERRGNEPKSQPINQSINTRFLRPLTYPLMAQT